MRSFDRGISNRYTFKKNRDDEYGIVVPQMMFISKLVDVLLQRHDDYDEQAVNTRHAELLVNLGRFEKMEVEAETRLHLAKQAV